MSPTPSDARPGFSENDGIWVRACRGHFHLTTEMSDLAIPGDPFKTEAAALEALREYRAPTRVDEAPEGEPVGRQSRRMENAFAMLATPEQPAVTGEPTCADCGHAHGHLRGRCGQRTNAVGTDCQCREFVAGAQENIGISQTASRASRPTVESEGSEPEAAPMRKGFAAMLSTDAPLPTVRLKGSVFQRGTFVGMADQWTERKEDGSYRYCHAKEWLDRIYDTETALSSTRTALQRVREASRTLLTEWDAADLDNPSTAFLDAFATLRALTSSETDQ